MECQMPRLVDIQARVARHQVKACFVGTLDLISIPSLGTESLDGPYVTKAIFRFLADV